MTIFPPKKHSPKDAMTDFTPCPKTIRLCIEALPVESIPTMDQPWSAAWNACRSDATKRLEALLPDPAEELVREWEQSKEYTEWWDKADGYTSVLPFFARYLINQGKVRP